MLSKKNHFSYCNCLSPNYLVLLQYFPMRHQGLLQLILNVGEKNKKTWESIEFCVGVFNNPQTSRSTIYLGYPDFCLFPICEKQTSRTWSDDIQCWGLPMGCLSHTENSEHPRGEKGKTGMWSLTVSGKGILWFCSLASAQILLGALEPITVFRCGSYWVQTKKREIKKLQVRIYGYTRIISYSWLQQITL